MMTPTESTLYFNIRKPLQLRLAQALQTDESRLAKLSVSELLSIVFLLWGHTNSLGSAGETITGLRELLGDELWKRPKEPSAEVIQ
jgi:hypothetical protein